MSENERHEKAVAIGEIILDMLESLRPVVNEPEELALPTDGMLLNCTEAAKYLGISTPTLRSYTRRGYINMTSMGGMKGYNTLELQNLKRCRIVKSKIKQLQ